MATRVGFEPTMSAAVAALRYPSATLRYKDIKIFLKNILNLITNKLLSLQKEKIK
jgi:hypothetical protein